MCLRFGNMCTCIYFVFVLFRFCVFILFMLLFNFVNYVFLFICLCILIFMYVLVLYILSSSWQLALFGYPNWGSSVFSSVVRQMLGYNSQRWGTARTLPKLTVLFCVLFVCKCVLYYCHRASSQSRLTNTSISNAFLSSSTKMAQQYFEWSTTPSIPILTDSSLSNNPSVRRYVVWDAASVVKHTTKKFNTNHSTNHHNAENFLSLH